MPANSRTTRGVSASLIILDEFAHFTDTAGPGSDEAMFASLQPSLRAFGAKGRMLLISTPNGRSGRFFEIFEQASGGASCARRLPYTPR